MNCKRQRVNDLLLGKNKKARHSSFTFRVIWKDNVSELMHKTVALALIKVLKNKGVKDVKLVNHLYSSLPVVDDPRDYEDFLPNSENAYTSRASFPDSFDRKMDYVIWSKDHHCVDFLNEVYIRMHDAYLNGHIRFAKDVDSDNEQSD
jgi:hypothetical protein